MSYPLGTVLASPVVGGSAADTYGTHYSYLGVGGWQEFATLAERDAIPINGLGNLDASGLGSGRRRLGMLVFVHETDTVYQLFVPYGTWTGLTNTQKVTALNNNANWVLFSSGGGGDAIKKNYAQASHGFSVGNVVSFNGSSFVKGIASVSNQYEFLGLVSKVLDANNFTLTYSGYIDLTSVTGISANTLYFVSPTVAGALTTTEPFNVGESSRPILTTQQATNGLVFMSRSNTVASSGGTGGGGTGVRIENTFDQTSHGFALGDVIFYSGTTFNKALATTQKNPFTVGIVDNVISANRFTVCFEGYVSNMFNILDDTGVKYLSGGTTYYLSPTVAGKLTKIKPTQIGRMITPIYQTITTADGVVINQKGLPTYIPISGVTGLTAALNSKINTSVIGQPSGIPPLNGLGIIPIQYIPAGLKEEFVVKNIAQRTSMFVPSGTTATGGTVASFRGLKVFVLNASGATGLPTGYTGSSEFIDTTGFLTWSATTGNVFINWNDVLQKPNLVNRIFAGTAINVSNFGTGNTTISVQRDNKYVGLTTGGTLTVIPSSIDTTRIKLQGSSGTTGQYLLIGTGTTVRAFTPPTAIGAIGPAEDGSYTDGIFTDFVPSTPIGTAVDRFNELFLLVLPQPPSGLTNINGSGTFVNGNLSWGVSRNDIAGYVNVGTNAGNAAVDINGLYSASGTRLGITNSTVTGILNNSVVGNITGIPYFSGAFKDGDLGELIMYKNGIKFSTLILSGTTASTSNTYMSVSPVRFVKASGGNTPFKYRTGTYTIPVSAMTGGYNYIRIVHSGSTFSRVTNFIEFALDNDATNLTASATGLTNLTLTGTKNLSGVKYHTSGTVQYQATVANAYKNTYSASATAIDFPTRVNLGALTTMSVGGAGVNSQSGSAQTLPTLNTSASNPQNTSINILATLPINVTTLLGNVGTTGKISSNFSVAHPFTSQQLSNVGLDSRTGFLFYNVTQGSVLNSEDFTGEVNRLEARDYTALTYANINGGTYAWDSTQSLIGANTQHNTGMLVFNGEMIYPNAAYLTTQYGITTGNFAAVTNSPAGNVNYTSATGKRDYYRKFKSANAAIQSTLTFTITHTGSASDFLTNGGTGGSPSSNQIKFEFAIIRSDNSVYGWENPFASTGNTFGITNTSTSQVGSVMTVSCTLSTTPRVGNGDLVVVRTFMGSSYANRVSHINVTNI